MLATTIRRVGLPLCVAAVAAAVACNGGAETDEPDGPDLSGSTPPPFSSTVSKVSLEEARERVDFDIAVPEQVPGDAILEGVLLDEAFWGSERMVRVELVYKGPGYSFVIAELPDLQLQEAWDTVIIDGAEAQVTRKDIDGRPVVTVSWRDDGLGFASWAQLSDEFTEEHFLAVLESIP